MLRGDVSFSWGCIAMVSLSGSKQTALAAGQSLPARDQQQAFGHRLDQCDPHLSSPDLRQLETRRFGKQLSFGWAEWFCGLSALSEYWAYSESKHNHALAACWFLDSGVNTDFSPLQKKFLRHVRVCVCPQVICPDFKSWNITSKPVSRTSNLQLENPTPKMRHAYLWSPPGACCLQRGGTGKAALQQALSIPQHLVGDCFWEWEFCLGFSPSFLLIWV